MENFAALELPLPSSFETLTLDFCINKYKLVTKMEKMVEMQQGPKGTESFLFLNFMAQRRSYKNDRRNTV